MNASDEASLPADWGSARWVVSGRVQGVGFRYHVMLAAHRLGARGDVSNLRDGCVEVRAQGPLEVLERLLEEVRTGPPSSRVENVTTEHLEAGHRFDAFSIR
jgi:acylphosphatase